MLWYVEDCVSCQSSRCENILTSCQIWYTSRFWEYSYFILWGYFDTFVQHHTRFDVHASSFEHDWCAYICTYFGIIPWQYFDNFVEHQIWYASCFEHILAPHHFLDTRARITRGKTTQKRHIWGQFWPAVIYIQTAPAGEKLFRLWKLPQMKNIFWTILVVVVIKLGVKTYIVRR